MVIFLYFIPKDEISKLSFNLFFSCLHIQPSTIKVLLSKCHFNSKLKLWLNAWGLLCIVQFNQRKVINQEQTGQCVRAHDQTERQHRLLLISRKGIIHRHHFSSGSIYLLWLELKATGSCYETCAQLVLCWRFSRGWEWKSGRVEEEKTTVMISE